ncbi:MAG: class I SAM-dependent methyltransferase [Methanosarcina sp.]|uniref:class I SAM-dependent methyltransferase n=1 Tax=Methanosarcina sp. TaxID=2213 RepID=UPI002605943E|nr:class I SAM-dependent methyltransferase [Methanosarcina sp.]MDD3247658.1 class I SAM-dependent methyltransferase [Methanosarcina sp.]MDD4249485.1 class I SAM-dependent methyltransferase [Methanosarcina sp.]
MNFLDDIINKLISENNFKYYPEDRYFIKHVLKFSENKNVKVLDVGCGNGHYSFLFEKYGANVTAFDYDKTLIKKANEEKREINSNVEFMIADGRYPEKYFTDKFGIIFLSGFALFGINQNKELMEKYLLLLDEGGKLIFVHSSNLTGDVRKTHWRNHKMEELKSFFESLDCTIEEIYFYDRHIIIKLLHSLAFNNFSTKMHVLISKITKLPCSLVFIVKKHGQTTGSCI